MPLAIRLDAELESGLRALSAEQNTPQAEIVHGLIRVRLELRKGGKSAHEISCAMGVIGSDREPRRDVAKRHSKYAKAALRRVLNDLPGLDPRGRR